MAFFWLVVVACAVFGNSLTTVHATTANTLNLSGAGYIRVPNAPELNPGGGVTFEAWVRRNNTAGCETVVGKNYTTGYWLGFCTASGKLRFYTGSGVSYDSVHGVAAGAWTHIAVTYNGCTLTMYLNGMRDYQSICVFPGSPLPVNADELRIGADREVGSPAYYFNGNIAEVRIWSAALTQTDIRRNFVRLVSSADPNLVAVWHLEGNANEALNHFPGTAIGTVSFVGSAAPPVDQDPIVIPQVASGPAANGTCTPGEYGDVRLPIWYDTTWTAVGLQWVYVIATPTDVFACMNNLQVGFNLTSTFASLYIDPNDSGDALAQATDYRINAYYNNTTTANSQHGDGSGDYAVPPRLCDRNLHRHCRQFRVQLDGGVPVCAQPPAGQQCHLPAGLLPSLARLRFRRLPLAGGRRLQFARDLGAFPHQQLLYRRRWREPDRHRDPCAAPDHPRGRPDYLYGHRAG